VGMIARPEDGNLLLHCYEIKIIIQSMIMEVMRGKGIELKGKLFHPNTW